MPELTPLLLVDLALSITLAELLLLLSLRRHDLVFTLLAGLGLMLSLRLALAGAPLPWLALSLMASGLLHAVDLRRRWSARRAPGALRSLPSAPFERTP
jgi:hypothetical protein